MELLGGWITPSSTLAIASAVILLIIFNIINSIS
jgi:hypothetical protein